MGTMHYLAHSTSLSQWGGGFSTGVHTLRTHQHTLHTSAHFHSWRFLKQLLRPQQPQHLSIVSSFIISATSPTSASSSSSSAPPPPHQPQQHHPLQHQLQLL
ncbi:hypothetical protein PV328_001238 [Microctonus aethiopoides]|uniref:Uncharacterized protein n=1 Tax=Microctonus aethiopoides TaxID=144406 RepID=A0AA39KX97_9HYME|nr:hypothetical protein PV328_001238 [Microctonus aethiopoides]